MNKKASNDSTKSLCCLNISKKTIINNEPSIFINKILLFTDKGLLPKECEETAHLLLFFDELFDSVNGSYDNYKKRSGKPLLGPVTPNSGHKAVWTKAKRILKSMKYISGQKSSIVPSITNWLHTIENMEYMVDVLFTKYNLTSLWMRHFNQDPLENFFGSIRSHGYRNTSPTCAGFEAAFASLLINNLSSTNSPGSNCEVDKCFNFKSLKELFFKKPETSSYTSEVDFDDVNSDNIFKKLEIKMENIKIRAQLEYVTGYILRKLLIKCSKCKECLYIKQNEENTSCITFREYFKNKFCLTYPSHTLIECFSKLQDVVTYIIKKDCKKKNIRQYIKTIFSIVIDYSFIKCPEHKSEIISKIEELSINIFIYNWCRDSNKILNGLRTDFDEGDKIQILALKCCKKRLK